MQGRTRQSEQFEAEDCFIVSNTQVINGVHIIGVPWSLPTARWEFFWLSGPKPWQHIDS